MFAGLAVLPMVTAAVAATPLEEVDPIFAAIERHRGAYREWMDSFGEDKIEAAVPEERRQSDMTAALCGDRIGSFRVMIRHGSHTLKPRSAPARKPKRPQWRSCLATSSLLLALSHYFDTSPALRPGPPCMADRFSR
jgi:hypothetical protein